MKEITGIVIVLLSVFLMSSCTLIGGRSVTTNNEKIADERMNEIVGAIENKDEEALKDLFSLHVLDEVENFKETEDNLFKLFSSGITSWERTSVGSEESIEYGNKSRKVYSWYNVMVDNTTYTFVIIDFSVDTIDPDNAGLYTLHISELFDDESQSKNLQEMEIPGISLSEELLRSLK